MTRVEISGAQHPVGELFGPRFTFSVPAYQRPYAWTPNEARELFQDLCDEMGESDAPVSELPPYFLGSIVVVSDGAAGSTSASIVDGQQRLTTLTILLAAIRALADAEHARALNRHLYEEGSPYTDPANHYRLELRSRDASFFRQYVQENGHLRALVALSSDQLFDSQRNMRDNAALYLECLGQRPEAWRFRFAQYVLTRCLLLVVTTNDLDSAYSIFSVLNNRGLDLTHADILKARLFGDIPEHRRDGLMILWEEIEDGLGRDGFETLFRHMCMIQDRKKAQGSILKQFDEYMKTYVRETGNQRWWVIGERIVPLGQAMCMIKTATLDLRGDTLGDDTGDINTTLRWLNQLPNADWLPPAIAFLAGHRDDSSEVASFFRDLERLAASMMVRHFNDNERIKRYANVLVAISAGKSLTTPDSPLQLSLDEQGATVRALNSSLARLSAQNLKYLLRRLDAMFSNALPSMYSDVTVEHVLPLNPPSAGLWSQWYKNANVRKQFDWRLGNLVLLPEGFNRRAANTEFPNKRAVYTAATSAFPWLALAAQARDSETWAPSAIDQRQAAMMKRLKSLWRLDSAPSRPEAGTSLEPAHSLPSLPSNT